jgi:hypothetical protein
MGLVTVGREAMGARLWRSGGWLGGPFTQGLISDPLGSRVPGEA